MRLLYAIRFDMLFQYRHGFYLAYGFVTLFYAVVLMLLPEPVKIQVLPLILFTDISVLGFFFIGGILLLEKDQNSIEALFVTPLKAIEYLLAKYVSLSVIATVATMLLYVLVHREFSFLPELLLIVWLNMFLYTFVGIALVANVKTVNDYFVVGVPVGIVLFIPLLSHFDIWNAPFLYLLPTLPTLDILFGRGNISAYAIMICWSLGACFIGYKLFLKHIVGKEN